MLKKIKISAKNEKQAILKASRKLNISENRFKSCNILNESQRGLFGIFKDSPYFEISYYEDENFKQIEKLTSVEDIIDLELRKKAEIAVKYLSKILELFGFFEVKTELEFCFENNLKIDLVGEEVGLVFKKFEKLLDSLQYLVGLCANQFGGKYLRITLDSGGYRENKRLELQNLVKKMATKVLETKSFVSLEPMNPFERQVVHSFISGINFLKSKSVGDEPYRNVIIYYKDYVFNKENKF